MLGRFDRSRRGSGEHRPSSTNRVRIACRADGWSGGTGGQSWGNRTGIVGNIIGRRAARTIADTTRTTAAAGRAIASGAPTTSARTAAGGGACCRAPGGARASRCTATAGCAAARAGAAGAAAGSATRASTDTAHGGTDGAHRAADSADGGTRCAGGSAYGCSCCSANTAYGCSHRASDTADRAGNLRITILPAANNGEQRGAANCCGLTPSRHRSTPHTRRDLRTTPRPRGVAKLGHM